MTPDVERFAELATRPLEGRDGLRDEARTELMSRISHIGAPLEMIDLSAPLERLEKKGSSSPWHGRGLLLASVILLVVSGLMTGEVVRNIALSYQAQMRGMSYAYGGAYGVGDGSSLLLRWTERTAPELPLLTGSAVEAEAASRENPEDVPMFQQALLRRMMETRGTWTGLSAEQREAADRIDPGNGFYDLLEMEGHMERALGGSSRSSSSTVSDEKAFAAAEEAFRKMAAAERFHDASGELSRRQLEAFPAERGFLDQMILGSFARVAGLSTSQFGYYYYRGQRRFFEIRAERLEAAADKEGMLELRDQILTLSRKFVEDGADGGVSAHVTRDWITSTINPVRNGLVNLGLKDEAAEIGMISGGLSSLDFSLRARGWTDESRSLRFSEWQDVPDDLRPEETVAAGLTEMTFIQRLILLAGVVILLVILLFSAIEAYRRPRRIVGMSRGLMPLLDWRDWLWIIGFGVILPWAWLLGVRYLTPLGLRDLPPAHEDGVVLVVLLVQSASALVMAVVMGLWACYWRWEKRGGFLAFRGGAMLLGRISGYLAALSIPVVGLVRYFDYWAMDEEIQIGLFLGVCGLSVCGLIWLIWITILNLCTPQSNALRANVVMRAFLPVMLTLLATLLIGAAGQRSLEHYWCARDTLFPSRTSETHVNALEERLEQEVRERVIELLDEAS